MRAPIETVTADGVTITSYRFLEKRQVARIIPAGGTGPNGTPLTHVIAEATQIHQLGVELSGGALLLEPGALQYHHGRIQSEIQRHEPGKGFLSRAVASAGTGESAFATRFSGTGTLWAEPTRKHFILGNMDAGDDLLLDDRAFYACTGGISLSTHRHTSVSGILSGNGFLQPKLSGRGAFVVESPVPVEEIDVIELSNGEAVVDGDFVLMFSASLSVSIGPLVSGLRNALRSGEGLVYKFSGTGSIWVMPTARTA